MTRERLLELMQACVYAVEASAAPDGRPQAAVVGIVVSEHWEVFFDTLASSRKCQNLRRDPRIAFVIGWDDAQTVQLEGLADEPSGAELERLRARYFERFPDGRERALSPDITYFRIRPTWIRYSDFRAAEPVIVEFPASALGA